MIRFHQRLWMTLDEGFWDGSAVGPFAQARDATWQEEKEECADPNIRKVTIERRNKGVV
jgi:hypothetical protein